MAVTMTFDLDYEDGSTQRVTADQRDMVIFERDHKIGALDAVRTASVTFFRHLSYSALRRQGLIAGDESREAWENRCLSARWDMSEAVDPGQPEARDVKPSISRSSRARASGKSSSTGSPRT
jgi:hypothetical protein